MAGPAQVRSIEAIARFRASLISFRERVQGSLEGLDGQLRRAVDWIEYDQPSYWKRATRDAEDDIHNAKMDLERCLAFPLISGEHPSCREEKALVAKCQKRLEYCREQVQRVKNWRRTLDHEVFEYQGRLSALRSMLEAELDEADTTLRRVLRRLEDYALEGAPVSSLEALLGAQDPAQPSSSLAPESPTAETAQEASQPSQAIDDKATKDATHDATGEDSTKRSDESRPQHDGN